MPDLPGKMKYQMVETHEELKKAAQVLAGARSIALDLEGDSMFHYGDTLCLAQVSDGSRTWLIDPLKIKDLSPLSAILGNTGVEKILHGSDYDIRLIRGRLGINCPPIFDTELAARFLGMSSYDAQKFQIPSQVPMPLTDEDRRRAREVREYPWFADKRWQREIKQMESLGVKLELEAFSSKNFKFITEEYVPRKLKDKDWLD